MINIVWKGFLGYMFAFGIKRLLCIEFRVFRKKEKKGVRGAEMAQRGYYPFSGLGCDRGFLCCDRAFWLCVTTWFSVSRHDSQATGEC